MVSLEGLMGSENTGHFKAECMSLEGGRVNSSGISGVLSLRVQWKAELEDAFLLLPCRRENQNASN